MQQARLEVITNDGNIAATPGAGRSDLAAGQVDAARSGLPLSPSAISIWRTRSTLWYLGLLDAFGND
jgi:hypothetical protein